MGDLIVSQDFQKVFDKGKKIVTEKKVISGRKIPLEEIRHKLLHKFKKYMRLTLDEVQNNLSKRDMLKCLKSIGGYVNDDEQANQSTLKEKIKSFGRTQHLMMWHNCLTVGGQSYLLMMTSCLYDAA